jgi:hypothetical protein
MSEFKTGDRFFDVFPVVSAITLGEKKVHQSGIEYFECERGFKGGNVKENVQIDLADIGERIERGRYLRTWEEVKNYYLQKAKKEFKIAQEQYEDLIEYWSNEQDWNDGQD